jgi:Zn-dependent protease
MAVYATRGGSFSNPFTWLTDLIFRIPGLLIGITIHEFAHAKASDMLGDPTPRSQGRLTLNPIRHFDLIGLISLMFIGFGWGKPVQVSPQYYKNIRRDSFIVDVAGVVTNFIAAILFAGLTVFLNYVMGFGMNEWLFSALSGIVLINLSLMIFNLLPIPPLDGFNMVTEIFNLRRYDFWYKLYNYGFPILMVFIMLGITSRVMSPILRSLYYGLFDIWGMIIY